jgi:glycosyltransferase involved in cell wall biosynthesis
VERGAYSLAHSVVVNADAVGRHLMANCVPTEKIVTIYNGLTNSRVTPQRGIDRQEMLSMLGLPTQPGRRFVTIVGNLQHEVKDHRTFLRAAARVHDTCQQAAFVLAGEGRLTDSLREFAVQLGLERDVFFIGRCEKIAELLSISEVCVLSSKAEGFSNAILEYMAAARPVVVTDVGGAREAVIEGETGYIVSPSDPEAMALRIVELLRDHKRAEAMGKRGRLVVEERFSCGAQRDRTLALYDRLLDRKLQTSQAALAALRRESA